VDATTAKLRAEDSIRRTELLRDLTSRKSFRIEADLPVIVERQFVPALTVGYVGKKGTVASLRKDPVSTSRVSIQSIFAKSRENLYQRLVRAFNSDCGCGCGGECQ
jgi:hypothetical protein